MRHRETEIKLEIREPGALKRRLVELGFRPVGARYFESNRLYDFPDLRLHKAKCLLRLRFVDGQCLLTFKGPPALSPSYKIRKEIETGVEDGRGLMEIFQELRLREVFRYDKYRTRYGRRDEAGHVVSPKVVYDETPIGDFVELEGARRWIDTIARQLGYERRDFITASYATLYRQKCEEKGEKPAHMVFCASKS